MPIALLHPTYLNSVTSKTFSARDDGSITKTSYKAGYLFDVDMRDVNGIQELSKLLIELEKKERVIIIRGLLHEDADLTIPVRRKTHTRKEDRYAFIDAPQNWVMIDIDNLVLPTGIDAIANPEEAIEYTIEQLPEEFHNVTYHWQFSSSHGVPKHNNDQPITDRIKIHLWFWLDKGVTTYDLKEWSKKYNLIYGPNLIDPSLYNAVQPHYITNPIFKLPLKDPITVRSGITKKLANEVSINLDIKVPVTTSTARGSTTTTTPISGTHGYEGILSELGDHAGGNSFHEPLLRGTASLVQEKGTKWIEDNMSSIIADLQDHIDKADQFNHSTEDIEKYRSHEYLEKLLTSAIAKGYGDHTKYVPPYFSKDHLQIKNAESMLSIDIQNFLLDAFKHNKSGEDIAPNLALKASAGLGKTTKAIIFSTRFNLFNGKNIEYYVPTHALAEELESKLREMLEEVITRDSGSSDDIQLQVIRGRHRQADSGEQLCLKHEEAKKLSEVGLSVEFYLCGNDTDHCEHYDDCQYRKQFKTDSTLPSTIPAINILTHNHLFLKKREELPKSDLVIVDESFFQVGIDETSVIPTVLRRSRSGIARTIFETLYDEKPLLKQLRDEVITPELLREEALKFAPEIPAISPTINYSDQQNLIGRLEQPDHIDKLLYTLADELEITDRDDSYSVELIQNTTSGIDTIEIHTRKELNIPIDLPLLFIDADANHNLINLFRPNTSLIEIAAERQAKVHQFKNTFSQYWIDKNPETIEQLKSFVRNIGQYSDTLVVTTKSIRLQVTGEAATDLERIGECEGASIIHFQNLRGLDEFKEYDKVIIIGRQQPSGQDMEAQAKALWWDEDAPLTLLPSKSGSRPYDDELRGYRMQDGSSESITTKYHPDRRVQDLLELTREHEIAQAIDRLRPVRDRDIGKAGVFILTSIPLDMTVDYLWDWKHLQEFIKLWEISDGVIPLNREHLKKCFPDEVKTISGSRLLAGRLKRLHSLISIYIRQSDLFSRYKTNPSARNHSQAIISEKHPNRRKALEDKLGMEVLRYEGATRSTLANLHGLMEKA